VARTRHGQGAALERPSSLAQAATPPVDLGALRFGIHVKELGVDPSIVSNQPSGQAASASSRMVSSTRCPTNGASSGVEFGRSEDGADVDRRHAHWSPLEVRARSQSDVTPDIGSAQRNRATRTPDGREATATAATEPEKRSSCKAPDDQPLAALREGRGQSGAEQLDFGNGAQGCPARLQRGERDGAAIPTETGCIHVATGARVNHGRVAPGLEGARSVHGLAVHLQRCPWRSGCTEDRDFLGRAGSG
jgi:hypothetical protein